MVIFVDFDVFIFVVGSIVNNLNYVVVVMYLIFISFAFCQNKIYDNQVNDSAYSQRYLLFAYC